MNTPFQDEWEEYAALEYQAYLAALPSWVADRIRCGTLKTWPTFLSVNPNGTGPLREPYESKYRELLAEVERQLLAKYHPDRVRPER